MSVVTLASQVHNQVIVDWITNHDASSLYPHLSPNKPVQFADEC